jgi:hypothetical protein
VKKLFLALIVAIVAALSLVITGCGGSDSTQTSIEGVYQVEFISNGGKSLDSSTIAVVRPGVQFSVWVNGIQNPLATRSRGGIPVTYTWLKNGQPFQPEKAEVIEGFYTIGELNDQSLKDIPFQVIATFMDNGQRYVARRSFFVDSSAPTDPIVPFNDRLSVDIQTGPDVNGEKTVTLKVKNISGYKLDTVFTMIDYSVTPIGDLVVTVYDWGHIIQKQVTLGSYDYMSGGTCTRNGVPVSAPSGVFMGLAWARFDEVGANEEIILQAQYRN